MHLRYALLAAALFGVAAAVLPAGAQNVDVIKERQQLMKNNGRAAKLGGQMLKGEVAFDSARAADVFGSINKDMARFRTLFPEDSKTGGNTEASPAIWERPAEFQAANEKMEADSAAALASGTTDLEAFKASFGTVTANCKGCHQVFRAD